MQEALLLSPPQREALVWRTNPHDVIEMVHHAELTPADLVRTSSGICGRPVRYLHAEQGLSWDLWIANFDPDTMHALPDIKIEDIGAKWLDQGEPLVIERLHFPPESEEFGRNLILVREAALKAGPDSAAHERYKELKDQLNIRQLFP